MPCYEPPRPDSYDFAELTRQRNRYIQTLKDIEEVCQEVLGKDDHDNVAHRVLDIIDTHWGRIPHDKKV